MCLDSETKHLPNRRKAESLTLDKEELLDQSQNKWRQGTGGRVQTRLERDRAKRQEETREQQESRVQTR